jgi:ABC-type sugar transport system permease subunit
VRRECGQGLENARPVGCCEAGAEAQTLIQFLADPNLALWSVIAVAIWQGTPFYTMMFLAAMQAIPGEQYEAAALDGAPLDGDERREPRLRAAGPRGA